MQEWMSTEDLTTDERGRVVLTNRRFGVSTSMVDGRYTVSLVHSASRIWPSFDGLLPRTTKVQGWSRRQRWRAVRLKAAWHGSDYD